MGFINKIKEILNLEKVLSEKRVSLLELDSKIKNGQQIYENYKNEGTLEGKKEAEKIVSEANSKLNEINNEILKKDEYYNQVTELKNQIEKLNKKLSREEATFKKLQYVNKKLAPFIENSNVLESEIPEIEVLENNLPTVELKLSCMDLKELRKRYKENEKVINETLEKYKSRYNTKANSTIYKLMVIALKAELQNVLYSLKYNKLDDSVENVKTITEKYLSISSEGNQSIYNTVVKFIAEIEYLFIQAVHIEYQYYIKKEQEKEEQAKIREQMRQEAEERRLLEQQQKQIEKEEEKYLLEIEKTHELIKNSVDDDKIKALEEQLKKLQGQLNTVNEKKEEIIKLQNGKAGYVYIISNLGSFGESTFKIGMTRRLNPQDRVDELGDASVPFKFDVHSFIFSESAVDLEQKLHTILNEKRVNKINLRKEFFSTTIDELENLVQELYPSAEFNRTLIAEEYRQSLSINEVDEMVS